MAVKTFVFGSNLRGAHGKGAALFARQHRGAVYGEGRGHHGNSYAIPTKDYYIRTRPLADIQKDVDVFIAYAKAHPELEFEVTALGTGLAGYRHDQIAPMFKGAPANCELPTEWRQYVLERAG